MVNVMIVDDQELVRTGIEAVLECNDDITVVYSTGNPIAALDKPLLNTIDVALVDSKMPTMSGADFITHLRQKAPNIRSIMLTAFDEDENLIACIRAGGKGHLLKDVSAHEIVQAIHTVAQGGLCFGTGETSRMVNLLMHSQKETKTGTSDPEVNEDALKMLDETDRKVATLVMHGATNREIAEKLFMPLGTVRNHLSAIFSKLGVRNRTELATLVHI
jgi:DNA-binding NarL/FixJ family response regulator